MVWDYSDKVKELFLKAVNHSQDSHIGEIENPDGLGFQGSLVCGDAIKLMFKVQKADNPINDRIIEIKYQTFGCTSAIASSEALCFMIEEKKMTPIEALSITKEDIIQFLEGLPTQKIHCSIMGLEAFENAVLDWAKKRGVDLKQLGVKLKYQTLDDSDDDKIVCECLGLTKGYLKETIINNNITTLSELMEKTKAGTVCGTCIEKEGGLKDILLEVLKNRQTQKVKEAFEMSEKQKQEKKQDITPKEDDKISKIKEDYEIAKKVELIMYKEIAPMLGYDGGGIEIISIRDKTVYFTLQGACSTCMVSDYTVNTIREILKEKVHPEIEVVRL